MYRARNCRQKVGIMSRDQCQSIGTGFLSNNKCMKAHHLTSAVCCFSSGFLDLRAATTGSMSLSTVRHRAMASNASWMVVTTVAFFSLNFCKRGSKTCNSKFKKGEKQI